MKYSGKIIRAVPPSTTTGYGANGTAGGMWTATEALQKKAAGAWPKAPTISDAPIITLVTPGNAQATINFTAPVDTGGLEITSYIVTSNPGNITASGSSSPITITGLTNDVPYTFTIRAVNSKGQGIVSSASSSVTPASQVPVELLLIAGGGGGAYTESGNGGAGAGGAGGLLYYGSETPKTPNGNALMLSPGITYSITIGAGGANAGGQGNNSVFSGSDISTLTAYGGGYGSGKSNEFGAGGNGGSGGGAYGTVGGTGVTGQGNNGGDSSNNSPYQGGGGGGAGAAGARGASPGTGLGGTGLQYSISGTSTYYAGGGSGGGRGAVTPGALGGGGNGASNGSGATSGAANTGGGGGGGGEGSNGGSGGSGVAIFRYSDTLPAATSTTGSPTITVSGGYRIYKFNNSGSITF